MPYASISELPPPVKDNLPKAAQEIFMAAFNSAHDQEKDEETCNKIAWAAVGAKYEKKDDKWVLKAEANAMTQDEMIARREKIEAAVNVAVHSIPVAFEATPGSPADPEEPKASEGMEAFRNQVYNAILARGWNVWDNPAAQHDFIITELFDSSVIVQDTMNSKFYRLLITVGANGEVVLGEPEEYDITFTPAADGTSPPEETTIATEVSRLRTERRDLALSAVAEEKNVYRILICNSGFARRYSKHGQLYMPPETLVDAVKAGRFDAGRCFWEHPNENRDETGEPKRARLVFAYIMPKSAEVVPNLAGGVDVFGKVKVISTAMGQDLKAILDEQIELGVALVENSIFSQNVTMSRGEMDGRSALICQKINERIDVDFVDQAAFPRSSVKARLAASAQLHPTKGSLTMDEKQELEKLRKRVSELETSITTLTANADTDKKRADRLELAAAVDKEVADSGLPPDDQALVKPILMAIADPDLRKAQLELSKRAFWGKAKRGPVAGASGTDAGTGTPNELRADVQDMVNRAAKTAGIKPEVLAKAQAEVVGLKG